MGTTILGLTKEQIGGLLPQADLTVWKFAEKTEKFWLPVNELTLLGLLGLSGFSMLAYRPIVKIGKFVGKFIPKVSFGEPKKD